MAESKKPMAGTWVDPDDAPDVSAEAWRQKFSRVAVKRGRPKSAVTKVSTTIRIDADVLEALKSTGSGWQTRANAILRAKLLARKRAVKSA